MGDIKGGRGKGGALPRPEPTMLRPDSTPRLGSPQASQGEFRPCPQDPTPRDRGTQLPRPEALTRVSCLREAALPEAGRALPTVTTLASLFPGTLLDTDNLYDEEVCTPDNLQK